MSTKPKVQPEWSPCTWTHPGLEWLNAMALAEQPPQRRLGQAEAQGATLEGETLIQERRADLLLQRRPERYLQVLIVPVVEPVK